MSVSADNKMKQQERIILVVDDSAYVRQMVRYSLVQHPYQLIESADGVAALECMDASHVDLVITDLKMPNMDGFELIHEIRKRSGCELLPIIMLTGEDDEKNRIKAREAGVSAFIVKPFVPEQISGLVQSVFS